MFSVVGTLAPPLLPPSHPDYEESIDVVFATDWFYPADTRSLLNAGQQLCVKLMMDNQTARFDPTSKWQTVVLPSDLLQDNKHTIIIIIFIIIADLFGYYHL